MFASTDPRRFTHSTAACMQHIKAFGIEGCISTMIEIVEINECSGRLSTAAYPEVRRSGDMPYPHRSNFTDRPGFI